MAKPGYLTQALVLRKTKLGESDLIVTLLVPDGSQRRVVAKGARKPTSIFAARLELYSLVDVLCTPGRSLDIVQEVRLISPNEHLRYDVELSSAAAPVAELLAKATEEELENPRLFEATKAVFAAMDGATPSCALALCGAHLLKTLAFCGLRPSFDHCVFCDAPVSLVSEVTVGFSVSEGGVICDACRARSGGTQESAAMLGWANYLLHSTYAAIGDEYPPNEVSLSILHLCQALIREHLGVRLRSLEFLFSSGLFDGDSVDIPCNEQTHDIQ